jgi:hypothetical protein
MGKKSENSNKRSWLSTCTPLRVCLTGFCLIQIKDPVFIYNCDYFIHHWSCCIDLSFKKYYPQARASLISVYAGPCQWSRMRVTAVSCVILGPHRKSGSPGPQGSGLWPRSARANAGLTMKRRLDPRGKTLVRSWLWRSTYSLMKATSSSWGKKLALNPGASRSSHSSYSHSLQTPTTARGSDSRAKDHEAFIVHPPPLSQCACASALMRCQSMWWGGATPPPFRPSRKRKRGKEETREQSGASHVKCVPQ